jgi:hypothetical protein
MISHPRTHKGAVLIAAYVMFACVAALLSVNLTSPTSAALGADWQCSRFAAARCLLRTQTIGSIAS